MSYPLTNVVDVTLYVDQCRDNTMVRLRDRLRRRLLDYYPQFAGHVIGIFEDYDFIPQGRPTMSFVFNTDNDGIFVAIYNIQTQSMTVIPVKVVSNIPTLVVERR